MKLSVNASSEPSKEIVTVLSVGLITEVGSFHSGFLKSRAGVTYSKSSLLFSLESFNASSGITTFTVPL